MKKLAKFSVIAIFLGVALWMGMPGTAEAYGGDPWLNGYSATNGGFGPGPWDSGFGGPTGWGGGPWYSGYGGPYDWSGPYAGSGGGFNFWF
jgi:hypothetical protein